MYSIYLVRCAIDGKLYVGLTSLTPAKRWQRHLSCAAGKHTTMYLHSAIRKHGADTFEWRLWENNLTRSQAIALERTLIRELRTLGYELYNTSSGGETGDSWKHTEESRQKMRRSHRPFKKRFRNLTSAHRKNIGLGQKGRVFSEEHRAKLRAAQQRRWQNETQ